jgi:7-keto-8-aminopelargonate synthetase-like enzyme
VPAAALAALDLVEGPEGGRLRQRLESNRLLFSELLAANGLDLLGSCTQIVPVLTHDPGITMAMSQKLLQRGIFLQGIRPPTVPEGSCRLRATVMATHSAKELRWAAQEILKVVGEVTAC